MSIAFIVEGHQEKGIIQRLCPQTPIRLISNGKTVSLDKITSGIIKHMKTFGNRYYPIIIIFDREKRLESVDEIIGIVRKKISEQLEIKDSQLIFGVPDRSIESWILPFVDPSGNFTEFPADISKLENTGDSIGLHKYELKKRLKKNNVSYRETTTGVDIFCNIVNASKLSSVSKSFDMFLTECKKTDLLSEKYKICSWLYR